MEKNIVISEVEEALRAIKELEDFNPRALKVILNYVDRRNYPEDLIFRTSDGAHWNLENLRGSTSNQLAGAFFSPYHVVESLEKAAKKAAEKKVVTSILVAPGNKVAI